jgi:hypothetical protein
LACISSEKIKFCHVISQLDHEYAAELVDIITSSPGRDPYITLEIELVRRLYPSREQCILQLLTLEEMGDRKQSQFLRHNRSLAPDVPDDFIRSIWSSRLSPNVKAILACQSEGYTDAAARCTVRIIEAATQPALASVRPLPDRKAFLQQIEDPSRQMQALWADRAHLRPNSRNRCTGRRSPS